MDEILLKDFKIKHPRDWETRYKQEGAIVHLIAPLDGPRDQFRENLALCKEEKNLNINLQTFIENQILMLKGNLLDFTLIQKKKTKLSGREAFKLMFSGKKEGLAFIFVQYYTLQFNLLISLNFVAEKKNYDNYRNILKKMIKSFEIT